MVQNMIFVLAALLRNRKGISALEYAILAAGIIGVVSVAAANLGSGIAQLFGNIVKELNAS